MNLKRRIEAIVIRSLVYLSFCITIGVLLLIVGFVLVKGLPSLKLSMFEPVYTTENLSMLPSIVNTVIVIGLSLAIAVPLGIFSAIYMNEYAARGSKFVALVRITTETLQGVPSVVYGLFGYLFFVRTVVGSYSLLAGALTLSLMVLPLIMRTAEEALQNVSDSYREGSFALGAGKLRTVFSVVLPAALGGIFAGIVLAVGRMVGETAALIYTAGAVAGIPESIFGMGSTLSVYMYSLYNEGINGQQSYAVAVILLLLVLILNGISDFIAWRMKNKQGRDR